MPILTTGTRRVTERILSANGSATKQGSRSILGLFALSAAFALWRQRPAAAREISLSLYSAALRNGAFPANTTSHSVNLWLVNNAERHRAGLSPP
jgi:hypothetical protein